MFGFMILVAESGSNTFGQMFRHEIGRETGKGHKMTAADSTEESGRDGATQRRVVKNGKFTLRSVRAKDAIGLVSGRRLDRERP